MNTTTKTTTTTKPNNLIDEDLLKDLGLHAERLNLTTGELLNQLIYPEINRMNYDYFTRKYPELQTF